VPYLLDTNVISELVRPRPDAKVIAWFKDAPDDALFLSVLSLGEIRQGVERLTDRKKRERLRVWLETEIPVRFGSRLLAVDAAVADRWGRIVAEIGRPIPAVDALLAATALHHGHRLVTRNESDFGIAGLDVVNPWQ
jgi:toxin FitB